MNISVIIPAHNRPKSLRRCLSSFKAQKYPLGEYEILVVDDGSKPSLKRAVDSFSAFLNIKYLYQENKGPSAARNLGIREAVGDIVAFLDDDCIPQGSWLYNIENAYKKNAGVNVIQGVPALPESINPFAKATKVISELADEVRLLNAEDGKKFALFFGPGNACIKKEFLVKNNLFFDETLITREDEDLFRRMDQMGVRVAYIPDIAVMHCCSCNPKADFLRHFRYGRGEYLLRRKWGDYTRLKYNITFEKIIRRRTVFSGVLIQGVRKLRQRASSMGFKYEEERMMGRPERNMKHGLRVQG